MSRKFEMKKKKFSFFKFEIFHFLNFKCKFLFIFFKKLVISPNGNEKIIEMKKSYISFMPPR
jgi:hypothetical protein